MKELNNSRVDNSGENQPIDNSSTLRKTLLQVAGKTLEFAMDRVISPFFNTLLPVVFPLANALLVRLDILRLEDHHMAAPLGLANVLPIVILPIVKRINNPSLSKIINPEIINSEYFKVIQYTLLSAACVHYGVDVRLPAFIVGTDVLAVVVKDYLKDSDEYMSGAIIRGGLFALASSLFVGAPYL